jgi:hypothetical protein
MTDDTHNAALSILHDLGSADEFTWHHECEAYGYLFDPDEFREIVEHLVADELVRVHCEDPLVVEERYMEDPAACGDEWPENPPIYEVVNM